MTMDRLHEVVSKGERRSVNGGLEEEKQRLWCYRYRREKRGRHERVILVLAYVFYRERTV